MSCKTSPAPGPSSSNRKTPDAHVLRRRSARHGQPGLRGAGAGAVRGRPGARPVGRRRRTGASGRDPEAVGRGRRRRPAAAGPAGGDRQHRDRRHDSAEPARHGRRGRGSAELQGRSGGHRLCPPLDPGTGREGRPDGQLPRADRQHPAQARRGAALPVAHRGRRTVGGGQHLHPDPGGRETLRHQPALGPFQAAGIGGDLELWRRRRLAGRRAGRAADVDRVHGRADAPLSARRQGRLLGGLAGDPAVRPRARDGLDPAAAQLDDRLLPRSQRAAVSGFPAVQSDQRRGRGGADQLVPDHLRQDRLGRGAEGHPGARDDPHLDRGGRAGPVVRRGECRFLSSASAAARRPDHAGRLSGGHQRDGAALLFQPIEQHAQRPDRPALLGGHPRARAAL